MELTKTQRAILKSGGCRTLVHATAGSGKTTILVMWIEKLLADGIDPEIITTMTFTINMAEELKTRVPEVKNVGTFHSICLQFLQKELKIYKKKIMMVNELEKTTIVNKIISSKYLHFRSKQELYYYIYNYYNFDSTEDILDFRVFIKEYLEFMRLNNLMDFDLLEYYTKKILMENSSPDIRKQFRYVIIDEYQDTSQLEEDIINLMRPDNLFVVGDIMQNIYAFRGTTIENMLNFRVKTPYHMQLTFRCPQSVCNLANHLIDMNDVGYRMEMQADKEGLPLDIIETDHDKFEENLRNTLEKYLLSYSPGDIFILCRTNGLVKRITDLMQELPLIGIRSRYWSAKYLDLYVLFLKMSITIYYDNTVELFIRAMQLEDPLVIESWLSRARRTKKKVCTIVREKYPIFAQYEALLEREMTLTEKAGRFFETLGYSSLEQDGIDEAKAVVEYFETRYGSNMTDFVNWVLSGDVIPRSRVNIEVMTVHQAKGLERDVVVIPYVEDDRFPHPNAPFQEELRLFYVACTRAKKQLVLLQTGQSVFLDSFKKGES